MASKTEKAGAVDTTIGSIIKEYRLKAGYSQKEIADILGYTQPVFVSLIEHGTSKVPLSTLGQLITLLKIPEKKVTKLLLDSYAEKVRSEIEAGKAKQVG